jgi:glycosyltransferase involved in cell wall biosynthesis
MKILIGSDLFYPILYTGGEVHTFNVARWLVKLGHEVIVIAAKTAFKYSDISTLCNEETVEGIKIIRTKTPYAFGSTIGSISSMKEMYYFTRDLIRKKQVDIVYPVKPRTYLPLFLAAHGKIPCVALIHDFYSHTFIGWPGWVMQTITLRLPYNHILTVSESVKNRLRKYHKQDRVSVIYNGLNLDKIDSVPAGPKKRHQVIFIGNLQPHKNISDAIIAVMKVKEQINDIELIIISTGGPQEPIVKAAVSEKPFIKYLGKVSDDEKIRLLKESGALILPSSAEGFGLVLIEALSCGTPFIAYDIPAVREVSLLTNGGILVPHRDYVELARQLVLLVSNVTLSSKLAEKGRRQVEDSFTWEKVARREVDTLSLLLESMSKRGVIQR